MITTHQIKDSSIRDKINLSLQATKMSDDLLSSQSKSLSPAQFQEKKQNLPLSQSSLKEEEAISLTPSLPVQQAVYTVVSPPKLRYPMQNLGVTQNNEFEVTKSNKRRYSSVVAEFLQKKNSLGPDPMFINPSTILTLQADKAGPQGMTYVEWSVDNSDDSYEESIKNGVSPNLAQDKQLCNTLGQDINMNGTKYQVEFPIKDSKLLVPKEGEQPITPIENNGTEFQSNVVAIKINDERQLSQTKSVSFDPTSADSTNIKFYSAFSDTELTRKDPQLPASSTPLHLEPCQLSFNQLSESSNIQCGSPHSKAQTASVDDAAANTSKGNNLDEKELNSKTFTLPLKSPFTHRGTYSVTPPRGERLSDRKNLRLIICCSIFLIFGIALIAAAFVIWFVVIPNLEASSSTK